jgi:hypothetical protein
MSHDWDKVLNWKLLRGGHKFPGPAGGTCINEAAIVAAGFAYRLVQSVDDCPPCFSRPIAGYALGLNDHMLDADMRQKLLLPFVIRLAGTADTERVENWRSHYIRDEIWTRLLRPALCTLIPGPVADELVKTLDTKCALSSTSALEPSVRWMRKAFFYHTDPISMAATVSGVAIFRADECPSAVCFSTAELRAERIARNAAREKVFTVGVQILDEAILLGKHESIDAPVAVERLNKAERSKANVE